MAKPYFPFRRPPITGRRPVVASGAAVPQEGPRDCVKIHRTLGDMVELVGYDEDGTVQIEVRIPKERMTGQWESWLLRWMRGWSRSAIKLLR